MTVAPHTIFRCCILSALLLWIPGQSPQSTTATLLGTSTGPDGTFRIDAVPPPRSCRAVA